MKKYIPLAQGFLALAVFIIVAYAFGLLSNAILNDPFHPTCSVLKGRCDPFGMGIGSGLFAVLVMLACAVMALERQATRLALQRN